MEVCALSSRRDRAKRPCCLKESSHDPSARKLLWICCRSRPDDPSRPVPTLVWRFFNAEGRVVRPTQGAEAHNDPIGKASPNDRSWATRSASAECPVIRSAEDSDLSAVRSAPACAGLHALRDCDEFAYVVAVVAADAVKSGVMRYKPPLSPS